MYLMLLKNTQEHPEAIYSVLSEKKLHEQQLTLTHKLSNLICIAGNKQELSKDLKLITWEYFAAALYGYAKHGDNGTFCM